MISQRPRVVPLRNFQPGKVPPNLPHPAHEFPLGVSSFVSYLPIKSPKSLRNKDFIAKPLFFKDLEKAAHKSLILKDRRRRGLRPSRKEGKKKEEGRKKRRYMTKKDRSFAAAQTLCSVSDSPYFSLSARSTSSQNSRITRYCFLNTSFSAKCWPVSNVPVVDTVICCPSAETTHLSF